MTQSNPPIVNIVGEKIALGPLRREAQRIGQQALDIVYMDCLAREFLADAKQ